MKCSGYSFKKTRDKQIFNSNFPRLSCFLYSVKKQRLTNKHSVPVRASIQTSYLLKYLPNFHSCLICLFLILLFVRRTFLLILLQKDISDSCDTENLNAAGDFLNKHYFFLKPYKFSKAHFICWFSEYSLRYTSLVVYSKLSNYQILNCF